MNVIKYLCKLLIIGFVLMGTLFYAGTAMLKGQEHASFFGYKLTDNYAYDEDEFCHIGSAIIIK